MQNPIPKPTLLDDVKAHAVANYERDGWDFVIECHSDEEIREAIGGAKTLKGALRNVRSKFALALHDERRREIISMGR